MYFCAIEQQLCDKNVNLIQILQPITKQLTISSNDIMRIPWALQKKKNQFKMSRIIRIFLKIIFMQPSYHENLSSRKFRGTSSLKTPQLRFLEYFTIICLTYVKLCFKLVISLRCLWNFLQSIYAFMFVYFDKNGLDAIKPKMHQAKVVTWTFW